MSAMKLSTLYNVPFVVASSLLIAVFGAAARGDWMIMLVHILKQLQESPTVLTSSPADEETASNSTTKTEGVGYMGDVHWYILGSVLVSFVTYYGLAGWLQWHFYIKQRHQPEKWKCQPERFLTPENERHEILLGSFNMFLGASVSGILACHIMHGGFTTLYFRIDEWGYTYLVLSPIALFIVMDFLSFYIHKRLHDPFIYKNIHKHHHRYHSPTAFSATAMHPLEFFSLQGVLVATLFYFPVYSGTYIVLILYNYYYGMIDHSGVTMDAIWPWQPPSMFHDDHHKYFHTNFGFNLAIWDKLFDTYRLKNRYYTETTFGGQGDLNKEKKAK